MRHPPIYNLSAKNMIANLDLTQWAQFFVAWSDQFRDGVLISKNVTQPACATARYLLDFSTVW